MVVRVARWPRAYPGNEITNARDDVRIRVLQRQDADVTQVEGQVAVERLEQALDDGEALRVARDDERTGAFIKRDDGLVLVAHGVCALPGVKIRQNFLHCRRLGVCEREDAHRLQARRRRHVGAERLAVVVVVLELHAGRQHRFDPLRGVGQCIPQGDDVAAFGH